ncbi:MAG: tetratricopeptide repeat protein [Gemmatimonadota bacterium]
MPRVRPSAPLLVLLVAGFVRPPGAPAQELRLGDVEFANSGAPEAQAGFERGLLLLHSFEYRDAADAFRAAQELDPDFAMAYWGEAMTYNHPIWKQQDREAALEALGRFAPTPEQRAEKAGPAGGGTRREAAYMRAVDGLYGTGEKEARDDAYADAMAELHASYPDDAEAAAFHALAILGTAHQGRDFATYMRSAGILEQVVDDHPRHPGIAHYLIHSYDDPIHAPLGIRAARAYSNIAPDAAHAQHMTSHIFVALGMWDAVVEANENSMRVVDARRAARDLPPEACGHYNFWLEYGYLEQGRPDDARRLLRECYERVLESAGEDVPDPDNSPIGSFAGMAARYVIDTGDVAPLDWPIVLDGAPYAGLSLAFARGWVAARNGDSEALEAARSDFREHRTVADARSTTEAGVPTRVAVLDLELDALHRSATGDADAAVEIARQAAEAEAAMPLWFGPPVVDKPTHELLGELLLAAGRPAEARQAFETALSRTPGRSAALEGLARAEAELRTAD